MPGFPKLLPSEAYLEWEAAALQQCIRIKRELARAGVSLPVVALVSIEAHIYRETNTGDTAGYIQAIGDMLQKAEIIKDDRQIEDFDGTRRFKDAINPRVEIFITIVEERAVQESLPIEQGIAVK
jgi:Holliday junction resolvase RusA-like endonuclease